MCTDALLTKQLNTMQHLQLAKQQTCFLCTIKGDEDQPWSQQRYIHIDIYIHIERDLLIKPSRP